MTKQEFLDTLRRALARELSESEVADNINYYWNYIEQQVAAGKSEEQVLSELGDPRLIAKTILQVDERREETEGQPFGAYQEEVYEEVPGGGYQSARDGGGNPFSDDGTGGPHIYVHRMTAAGWAKVALAVVLVCIVLGTIFHILWKLLPFLIVAAVALWIYRKFTER